MIHSTGQSNPAEPSAASNASAAEDADKWNWQDHFGRAVDKDDPIWKMYVDVATAHDGDVIETMNRTMDILLIFAGLFSAVVTALLVQMDQAIQPSEPNAFMAKVLKTISLKQLNPILHTLQPSLDLPSLEEYTEESISTIRITMILWYISLECALFVAGGAVCMKLWLVEYRRSNSKYRSSYHRAMHHQQTYASLRRWYVPEFGDLLGSIMMLDLIPFFFGLMKHLTHWKTGNWIFYDFACFFLAFYSAFLTFTTLIAILFPKSPYHTPISNMLKTLTQNISGRFTRNASWAVVVGTLIGITILVCSFVPAIPFPVPWALMLVIILIWFTKSLLYSRRRQKAKTGQAINPVTSAIIALGIWILVAFRTLNDALFNVYTIVTIIGTIAMILMLARQCSTLESQRYFPTNRLLCSISFIFISLFLLWNFEVDHWLSRLSWPLAPLGVLLLLLTHITHLSQSFEEDTTEAEALGWLISQTDDTQTLYHALSCVPSVGSTPLRRQVLWECLPQTLAFLIDSLIHKSGSKSCTDACGAMARIGDDRILDQESRLLLYLASLAEVSQMATEDRFAFVLPSSNVWGHLLRKLKIVRNSARQPHLRGKVGDLLETNLKVLSTHNNPCLSGLSRAILYQLYPTTWLNATASFLEDIGNNQSTGPNYSSQYAKLAEIRMLRAQVMDAYRIFGTIEPSIGRYIYRYCVVILDQCKFDDSSSKEGIFEATLDLAHLIMIVRGSQAVPLASGGDSILEKAAACLKELKSILDRDNGGGMVSGSETKLLVLLANSLVIAVERYLSSLLTKSKRRDPLGRHGGVYGSSTIPGVKLLEGALLQTLRQGKCHFAIDKVARIITILYSADMTPTNPPFHLDGTYDVTALMAQLSTRAHSTVNAASDRVPAIRALLRILNNMPTELAWYTALAPAQKGHPTISEIIVDIARDESLECRSAAFSAILETHIFRPSRDNFNRYAKPANQPPEDSNGNFASQEIRLMVRQAENSYFQRFYEDLLEDPSPLLQAIEGTELDKVLTYKAISIISLLVQLSPPDFSPKFLVNNQLFRAVVSVASHEDTTLVPISTRTLAIQLFAWLWRGIDQRQTLQQGEQSTDYAEVFNPNPLLAELTKGIAIVVEVHASIELECVSILVERLEIIFASLGDIQTLAQRELIDGLAEAVLWADLGRPVEDDREKLLSRLDALKIMDPVVSNSQLQLTLGDGRDTCSHELYK